MLSLILALLVSVTTIFHTQVSDINPDIYNKAVHAWNIEHRHNHSLKPIITIVDFTKPDYEKRMWIIDLRTNEVIYSGLVAHGVNSGGTYVERISNRISSKESSIGVFLTRSTYWGHSGHSLRIIGLEAGINDNVLIRHIIVHGANYVNNQWVGHSWGCFAVPRPNIEHVIKLMGHNSLMFVYYPDSHWLHTSRFLNA